MMLLIPQFRIIEDYIHILSWIILIPFICDPNCDPYDECLDLESKWYYDKTFQCNLNSIKIDLFGFKFRQVSHGLDSDVTLAWIQMWHTSEFKYDTHFESRPSDTKKGNKRKQMLIWIHGYQYCICLIWIWSNTKEKEMKPANDHKDYYCIVTDILWI